MNGCYLFRVLAPNFTAGAVVCEEAGAAIVESAPILRRFRGGPIEGLVRWCNQKGFATDATPIADHHHPFTDSGELL